MNESAVRCMFSLFMHTMVTAAILILTQGFLSFPYAFFRSSDLAVATPCVMQGDQNLFLLDKFDPSKTLLLAIGKLMNQNQNFDYAFLYNGFQICGIMTSKRKLHALTPEVMNQQLPDVFDALLYVEDLLQHKEDSHVTNYITIRLVTILEQFCRKVIEHKIENNEDSITVPTIIEIKTNDLDKIKKINKANVISISYNFPNIGTIDSTFNDYNIKNIWNNIDASIKKDLEELIYNRHNVVHTVSAISYDVKRGYDALEAFMKYICRDIFKTDNEFYYSKGYSLYKLKKFTQAIACFDKIISSNADNTLAYVWKGFTLLASGQSVEAIECFDKAIEIDPNNSFLHTHKGIVLATLGERIKAIECFDKAIEINPKDYFSYTNKGITLVELDKPAKAIEYFNKAIEINSRFSATHKAKGTALKMLGKYDEAERCYSVVNDLKKHEEDTVNIPVLFLPSL